ncbi:MAG: putative endonuclease [Actinomycetia bacterium]|nr:putative endonuclease [Actinomycetes bacterium]
MCSSSVGGGCYRWGVVQGLGFAGVSTEELVGTVGDILAELAARPVTSSAAECLDLVEELGASLELGESVLAGLLLVADRADEAKVRQYAGTGGFLRVALGMRQGRVNERLLVTRQLPRMPRVTKLLASGELSYGFVSTICDAVHHLSAEDCAAAEEILLGAVESGVTPAQVARMGERIADLIAERDGTDRAPDDARRGERSWFALSRSLGGSSFVKGRFTPELTALFMDRLGALTKPSGPDDLRSAHERWADALELVLSGSGSRWNASLVITLEPDVDTAHTAGSGSPADAATTSDVRAGARTTSDVPAGDVPQADRRVPVWPLETVPDGWKVSARLADGTPLPIHRARTIALNAGVSTLLLGADGIPIYLGPKVRFVTTGQRRVLEALYDTCAFQECDIPARFCEIDHVLNFSDYPLTDVDLLAPCCRYHNVLKYTHTDQITTTRDARGRWQHTVHHPGPTRRRGRGGSRAQGP